MPFSTTFDPATPTDADPASSGDDELRSIKAGVIERMNTIVEDFEDGTDVEGDIVLKLKDTVFPDQKQWLPPGILDARPNPPEKADLLFYATDTDQLFYSIVDPDDADEFIWKEGLARDEDVEIASLAISAGESRFLVNEDDTRATRVKNAINTARLSSSEVKVIYIPKSLWGYGADIDFDINMFDPLILLVREGSMVGWYDPVAYGADTTGTANSRGIINVCYQHASTTTTGIRMVAFTVPGTYLMTTDVDQLTVPLFMGTGTALSGGGALTGTRPFRIPADTVPQDEFAYTYTVGGSAAAEVVINKRLHLQVRGTATGTDLTFNWTTAGLATAFPLAKLVTVVATQTVRTGTTGTDSGAIGVVVDAGAGTILFTDLASGTNTEINLDMIFSV